MNRIYLDKLCEFTNNTYKLYNQFIKKNILDDVVESIKQNNSLNEKGVFNKYNFMEINNIISDFEFNELILLMPLTFNICDNINWYNLLNSLLLILNNDYIHETNVKKKLILETTNNIYSKKINITNDITNDFLTKISNITNICLIIINYNKVIDVNIYNKNDNIDKYIVLFKDNNNFFPIINWEKKYYDNTNEFIKYLIKLNLEKVIIDDNITNSNIINSKETDSKTDSKTDKIKKNKNKKIIENNKDDDVKLKNKEKKDDCYEELITNENYALYISEVVDNKKIKKNTSDFKKNEVVNDNPAVLGGKEKRIVPQNSDSKKKSKNSKDIFLSKEIKEENIVNDVNDKNKKNNAQSVFKKTENLSKEKIDELIKSIKSTSTLSYVQEVALKLNIITVSGSTKTGKPKNKNKLELVEEIKIKYM